MQNVCSVTDTVVKATGVCVQLCQQKGDFFSLCSGEEFNYVSIKMFCFIKTVEIAMLETVRAGEERDSSVAAVSAEAVLCGWCLTTFRGTWRISCLALNWQLNCYWAVKLHGLSCMKDFRSPCKLYAEVFG